MENDKPSYNKNSIPAGFMFMSFVIACLPGQFFLFVSILVVGLPFVKNLPDIVSLIILALICIISIIAGIYTFKIMNRYFRKLY